MGSLPGRPLWARYESKGTKEDDRKAFTWYRKAAEQGDAIGLMNAGVCHMNGIGTPIDLESAEQNLRQAVSLGEPLAKQYLNVLLRAKAQFTKTPRFETQKYDPRDINTWPSDSQYRDLEYRRRENAMFGQ